MPWAFLFFAESFGMNMSVGVGCSAITTNVSGLGVVVELEARMYNVAQMFIRIPNVQFSTEPDILPNCLLAEVPFLFFW